MILLVDGGDGDQSYFGERFTVESQDCTWFVPQTPRGDALLFKIRDGKHKGEFVALTSRVLESLEDQFKSGGASVVFNVIRHPGEDYKPTLANLDGVGMTYVQLLEY